MGVKVPRACVRRVWGAAARCGGQMWRPDVVRWCGYCTGMICAMRAVTALVSVAASRIACAACRLRKCWVIDQLRGVMWSR